MLCSGCAGRMLCILVFRCRGGHLNGAPKGHPLLLLRSRQRRLQALRPGRCWQDSPFSPAMQCILLLPMQVLRALCRLSSRMRPWLGRRL